MEGSCGRLPSAGCGRSHRRGTCSERVSALEEIEGMEKQTIVHTPLRSWSVLSGGAAIVEVLWKCDEGLMFGEQWEGAIAGVIGALKYG